MPLQTYNQYFGPPAPIRVPDPVNAFASGVASGQRQQGLDQEQVRTNEFAARGQHDRGLQDKEEARKVVQDLKEKSARKLALLNPDDPESMKALPQVLGEVGKLFFDTAGEDATPDLVVMDNILKNPDPEYQKTAVKHLQTLLGVTPELTWEAKETVKHKNAMELEGVKAVGKNTIKVGTRREEKRGNSYVQVEYDGESWNVVEGSESPRPRPPVRVGDPEWKAAQDYKEEGSDKKAHAIEMQRMRTAVAKMWGASEFASMDENTSAKASETSRRARKYIEEDGMNMDEAIGKAYTEIRQKYAVKELSKNATSDSIQELVDLGIPPEEVRGILRGKGMNEKNIEKRMKDIKAPKAAGGDVSQMTDEEIMADPEVQAALKKAGGG